MTPRDLAWRGAGIALFAAACAFGLFDRLDVGGGMGLIGFGLALAGLVLIVQGKRVPATWRIERSRHRALAAAIRMRQRRRQRPADGDVRPATPDPASRLR